MPHVDLDPAHSRAGSAPSGQGSGQGSGRIESGMATALWQAARPPWTQAGWWDAELRPQVRALLWLPVGRELLDALLELSRRDVADSCQPGECPAPHTSPTHDEHVGSPGFPCGCQIVTIAAWAAAASWTASLADRAVLAAAGSRPVEEPIAATRPELGTITDAAVEDLAPALRVSPGSARNRLDGLRRMHALPALRYAVQCGLIIGWHAHLVATDFRHLTLADQTRVVEELLTAVRRRRRSGRRDWTCTELRAQAKRIAARLELDLAARRKESHRFRGVRLRLEGNGSATLSADLAEDVATGIFNRVTAIAAGLPAESDDPDDTWPHQHGRRSLDQRRADVFTDLLLATPTPRADSSAPETPGAPGSGSEVAVVIDAATLLGLAETPGEVPGCGPVPAEVARALAADASWRAWITRTTAAGTQVVATSPGTYRPGAALARLIRARDPHCRMPGCRSTVTDLDHIVPFPRGQTVPENLHRLCRRHHRLKTHTRWRVTQDSDTQTWTSPTTITYTDDTDPPLP